MLYKIKIEENDALKLKARIALHGNEDSIKHDLRSDCSMYASLDALTLISIATVCKWRLSRVDVRSAFLQTGAAEHSLYVISP